jgi:hypothetical protein
MNEDDDADEKERAEAEALARALEGTDEPSAEAPGDTLETAALLRAVAASQELSSERAKAVYEALESEVERRVTPVRSPVVVWIGVASTLAAAAAVLLFLANVRSPWLDEAVQSVPVSAPARPPTVQSDDVAAAVLPAPRRELLAAQAALGGKRDVAAERTAFEREMRAYRVVVLRKLKESYPTKLGMLAPPRSR